MSAQMFPGANVTGEGGADETQVLPGSQHDPFDTTMRGYHRKQVDDYVARTRQQIGELEEQVAQLRERLARAEGDAEQARAQASEARQALAEHQPNFDEFGGRIAEILKLAEQEAGNKRQGADDEASRTLGGAKQEAERVRGEANQEAERIVTGAESRARELEQGAQERVEQLDRQHDDLVSRLSTMRDTLEGLMHEIDSRTGGQVDVTSTASDAGDAAEVGDAHQSAE